MGVSRADSPNHFRTSSRHVADRVRPTYAQESVGSGSLNLAAVRKHVRLGRRQVVDTGFGISEPAV